MNNSILAVAALIAGLAIAVPMLAWSAIPSRSQYRPPPPSTAQA